MFDDLIGWPSLTNTECVPDLDSSRRTLGSEGTRETSQFLSLREFAFDHITPDLKGCV